MSIKKIELEGSKETLELYELCAKVVEKIGEAKKLGLDTGAAVALVVSTALEPALVAMQGIDQIGKEHAEAPVAAVGAHAAGAALLANAIAKAFIK